jgi:chromosome segregation ATPase
VSTLLLKNATSPGSAASSPGFTAISTSTGAGTRDGNGPLPVSVKGRKLSLPALEAECDALWEDIPNAVETVMGELKQYHLRAVTLSADLQNTRVSSTSMSTELSTHVSRQQQEILSLKHEIETREIAARKRLEKYKTASQAEFTSQIERLKGDLTQMSQQIDTVAADKAQQVSHLRSERAAVQAELDAALQKVQDLARQNASLQDSSALAEKRVRSAASELIQEVKSLPSLPLDDETTSTSARSSPSHTHHAPHHFETDASIPAEHLLTTAAVQIRSKGKELARFLKSRKRSDTQQSDAMKTFVESLNSSFVSVTQSHRAHLLHDQLHLLGTVDSPIKSTTSVAHPDHSHLYAYLCGDDAELANMLHTLEDSIFHTLQRSMNVETHLIHKQKEMTDLRAQLADVRADLSREQDQKAALQTKIHRLEAHLHENISEIGRTNEEMGEREAQLIRDRELLEMDLTELEERYQISSQKNDHLESAVSNLEEELGGVQQELRDARKTLDEVFSQLQASQGKLGDMQHELRGVQYERDALQQRQAQLLQSHEAATARLQDELSQAQRTIADLRAEHQAYTEQVVQLRDVVSEGNGTTFQLENINGKLKLQLAQAEENIGALTTELLETKANLSAELLRTRQSLTDAQALVEEKLVQIVSSERQIAELCGDVEIKSHSLLEESATLRQVKDQLAYSSTALANLQINHSTLQKDHDIAAAQLADMTERNNVLGAQVDEQTATIDQLRRHVSSLQLSTHRYESFHEELTGRSEELTEQLRVYEALDTEFHELQDELNAKKEEFEQVLSRRHITVTVFEYCY